MKVNQHTNRLIHENSPYLQQHAHNPVDWYAWSEEAFAEAIRRDVPIFLSIGYSSCHWCHVMERECFEDEKLAEVLNDNFVCIKVDREEMPDIDHLYMNACMAMTGQGGWPLSCFLNHDRKPFFAGTYFPKGNFKSIICSITSKWINDREDLQQVGEEVVRYIEPDTAEIGTAFDSKMIEITYERLSQNYDKQFGGFGSAPKFPSTDALMFLIRYHLLTGKQEAADMVINTLEAMARGGIYDQIGGGFCRYSTDRQWLVPHFEKMMYDNALLSIVYLEAGAAMNEKFLKIAKEILQYCFNEMYSEGGFYTAQDADSEGQEGKYYLFTTEQMVEMLGEKDGSRYCELYDITPKGNFEGSNIPNLIGRKLSDEEENFADQCKTTLYANRLNRIKPFRDDKYLTANNGLMLAALSTAYRILEEDHYLEKARKLGNFILDRLEVKGRLMSGFRNEPLKSKGTLDDYAYVVWGMFELYEVTMDSIWLDQVRRLTERALDLFLDQNVLYLSGKDVNGLPVRTRSSYDSALPSGSSIMINSLLRLTSITGDSRLGDIANRLLTNLPNEIKSHPTAFTSLISACLSVNRGNFICTPEACIPIKKQ